MMTLTRNETAQFLLDHDNYTILTHRRPDGDTVGSAAALCLGLRQLGKTAHVLENTIASTSRFTPLLTGLTKPEAEANDTIVSVDVASPGMLPSIFQHLAEKCSLRIDHHGTGTPFAEKELVEGESASCAELICDLLGIMGVTLDKDMAEAIYVGASTDTGCFRFANTTAHTFQTAAVCARAGADIYKLNQQLFETNTLSKLRMHAWIVENMKFLDGGKLAVVAIPKEVEDRLGVTEDDMDNISSFPRTVEGVCMSATIRQPLGGETKISVRAIPGYDAAALCARFGGGGHKGAAGASTPLSLEDAAQAVVEAMTDVLEGGVDD